MPVAPLPLLRTSAALALALGALAGCGTKGENKPLVEAKYQVPKPVTSPIVRIAPEPGAAEVDLADIGDKGALRDAGEAAAVIAFAGRRWQATATEYQLAERMLRPVGSARGITFYALAWDQEPYDRLLAPAAERQVLAGAQPVWREYLDIY